MAVPKVLGVFITNQLDGGSLLVSWGPLSVPVLKYKLYRALSMNGDYLLVGDDIHVSSYLDISAYQWQRTDYWYRVSGVDDSGEGPLSDPVVNFAFAKDSSSGLTRLGEAASMNHARILYEVVRRNELLLRRGGEQVDVWVKKTAGERCTACYVPERDQPTYATCSVCFGTGFTGGYEKYPDVLMKIEPYKDQRTLVKVGNKWLATPRSWVTTFPLMRPDDVVVRRFNNRRYIVGGIDEKISKGIVTRQEFDLMECTLAANQQIFMIGQT